MRVIKLKNSGLSLIELMLSLTIIAIIAGIAIPVVEKGITKKKEEMLFENLLEIRHSIDRYYMVQHKKNPKIAEWKKYPKSLKTLVETKFLRRIPKDPFTGKREYSSIYYETDPPRGLFDIRSKSDKLSLKGDLYSSW